MKKRTVRIDEETWTRLEQAAIDRSAAERRPVSISDLLRRGVSRELQECGRAGKYRRPR